MSKLPFMPLSVADFLADTMELDTTATGAYMLLLMTQWKRGGASLPMDPKRLKRITRCTRNWNKIWDQIKDYFEEDEDGVYNRKCRLVAHEVNIKVEANKRNGARGGRAKALKYNNSRVANANNPPKRNPTILELESELKDTSIKSKQFATTKNQDHINMPLAEFSKVLRGEK